MDSSRARESRCHSKARTCATGLRLRSLSNYVHLVGTKFTKWSNFVREAWLIKEKWNKRSCLKPPMNADARRCSAPLIGVHRRFPILGGMTSLAMSTWWAQSSQIGQVFYHGRDGHATKPSWHGRPARD